LKFIGLAVALSLLALNTATAAAQETSSALDANHFSVGAGIGFFAEDNFDGFLLNFDGRYHFDEHLSAGVDFQFGFDDDFLLFSLPLYGRYDFGKFEIDTPILKDMNVFTKLGMGFTYAEFDHRLIDTDDTGFLFVIGGGLAYSVNEHISFESRMQFNITTNDLFEDDFYFSWEVLSARYRF
jgi:hypothetical protein